MTFQSVNLEGNTLERKGTSIVQYVPEQWALTAKLCKFISSVSIELLRSTVGFFCLVQSLEIPHDE